MVILVLEYRRLGPRPHINDCTRARTRHVSARQAGNPGLLRGLWLAADVDADSPAADVRRAARAEPEGALSSDAEARAASRAPRLRLSAAVLTMHSRSTERNSARGVRTTCIGYGPD